MILGWPQAIVLALALQRLAELAYARRNTRRLLAQGAFEAARGRYPLMVAFHAGWLVLLFALAPADEGIDPLAALLMLLLQGARIWVLATLGTRWTTRIIVLPGAPLVRSGPYRWVAHPNYLSVAGEIAAAPMMFGLVELAIAGTVINTAIIVDRIVAEERALRRVAVPAAPS